MGKSKRKTTLTRPLVGIAVDAAMGHGRSILRGAMAYANVSRRWLIHEELRIESVRHWPKCDGTIVVTTNARLLGIMRKASRCLINCAGGADPTQQPVVRTNDKAVGRLAAEHLIDARLTSFGFYGRKTSSPVSTDRLAGFSAALSERGFECDVCPVDWPVSYHWTDRLHWPGLTRWLASLPKPIGVFAMDDASAHDLAAACLEANLIVPEQIAIIGVNNDDLLCDSAWPPLSSIATEPARLGFQAAQLLDRMMSDRDGNSVQRETVLLPVGVVRRVSTDTLAIDDRNVADAIRFIRERACGAINVADLLRHVPVNRRWLERQFQRHLGRSPHDEIVRVRIEAAKRMLLATDVRVEHIAEKCGFGSVQTFGRQFLSLVGNTPAAWRSENRSI